MQSLCCYCVIVPARQMHHVANLREPLPGAISMRPITVALLCKYICTNLQLMQHVQSPQDVYSRSVATVHLSWQEADVMLVGQSTIITGAGGASARPR